MHNTYLHSPCMRFLSLPTTACRGSVVGARAGKTRGEVGPVVRADLDSRIPAGVKKVPPKLEAIREQDAHHWQRCRAHVVVSRIQHALTIAMTLGSALPWKALRRLHPHLHAHPPLHRHGHRPQLAPSRSSLPSHANVRHLGHGAVLRTQYATAETRVASPPGRSPPSDGTDTPPSSLIDRLIKTPIRRHGELDSVVVKPVDVPLHRRERELAKHRNYKELVQQTRIDAHRRSDQPGDWRAILDLLIKWTPEFAAPQDRIKVTIPRDSVQLLLSVPQRDLWNIKSRVGRRCKITLYRPREPANADPYIMLGGLPTAIIAAVTEILSVTSKVKVLNLQGSSNTGPDDGRPSSDAAPSVTETPIFEHKTPVPLKPYYLNMRADRIPRPREWTFETFDQYVARLVMGCPPRRLSEKLYSGIGDDTHQAAVVAQLRAAFDDPAASAAVSSPAFKLALWYLTQSGQTFVGHAQALFDRVRTLGLPMDTEAYNMMASTTVSSKNLFAFKAMIRRMLARKLKPDKKTWLLFLRMIEAEEVRRYILHSMLTKGFFLDPETAISAAAEMAEHDAYRAVQLGQDIDAFLAGLRELYGPEWRLTLSAANRYLNILGRHSKFDDVTKLLRHMWTDQDSKPDAISLNTVLARCRSQRKVDLAVEIIRMFDDRDPTIADEHTMHLLLELARNTCKPHLFGAIWRYAHLVELMTSRPRSRGLVLLRSGGEGAREVRRLTDRVRRLWEDPVQCSITKTQFVRHLLLWDYQKAVGDPAQITVDGRTDGEEHPGSQNASAKAPQPSPLEKESMRSRFADVAGGEGKKEPDSDGTKKAEDDSEQRPKQTFVQRLYDPFAKWMYGKSKQYAPGVRFGTFLQAALDRDRRLHKLAHEGVGEVRHGMPVDLLPVELPLKRDYRRVNRMLTWEGAEQADDGVLQGEWDALSESKRLKDGDNRAGRVGGVGIGWRDHRAG